MPNIKAVDRRAAIEKYHCIICAEPIPESRMIRQAVTCSKAHAEILRLERRRLRDLQRCRLCNRPSTPEERKSYAAWRKSLPREKETRGRPMKAKPPLLEAQPPNSILEEQA